VHETSLTGYVALMATQNERLSSLTVNIYGTRNPSEEPDLLASEEIEEPDSENLVSLHFLENYFQDEIIVESTGQARIAGRSILVEGVASKSFIRRET